MNDRQRLEAILAVVCRYLPPDGISREEAMSQIISLVDPLPEQEPWDTSDMAHRSGGLSVDMSTKEQNSDTSEERVHETDKSIHEDDDIQEYKRPWVGLSDDEVHKIIDDCTSDEAELEELIDFSIAILAVEAKLKEKNT